jgi:hypothetical protein
VYLPEINSAEKALIYLTLNSAFWQAGEVEILSLELRLTASHIWWVRLEPAMTKTEKPVISAEQLAHLGGGVLAYVRKIEAEAAAKLLGNQQINVPPNAELFCLYNANGAPISISQNYEAALGSAFEHELIAASVH